MPNGAKASFAVSEINEMRVMRFNLRQYVGIHPEVDPISDDNYPMQLIRLLRKLRLTPAPKHHSQSPKLTVTSGHA